MKIFPQNRTCLLSWLSAMYVLLGCVSMGHGAGGGQQEVTLMPETVSIKPGEQVNIHLSYNVIEGDVKTTGIGIRIHYNSSAISELKFKDIYGESIAGIDYTARDDVTDLDNDPLTDKFIAVAWAGVAGDWPMFLKVPAVLGTIAITVRTQDDVKNTKLNITASGTATSYKFHCKGAMVLLQ